MKIQNGLKKNSYVQFTMLFSVVAFFSFLEFILNRKSFLVSDTISEYVTSLAYWGSYLRDVAGTFVRTGRLHFPQWDFSLGLGADIISTLNWYVAGDPLTLLSALVKPEGAVYLHHVLAVLRLYLSGLAFLFYCRSTERNEAYSVCGALVYVFSGYAMFLAYRHTYFINPFIYLPLLYVGVEKILHGRSPVFFIITVFISCVSNFYFFYILTLLTAVYAFVRFFCVHTDSRLHHFACCFSVAVLAYIIGVLLASAVFLPNVFGFMKCGRSGSLPALPLFYNLKYYFKVIIASISPSYIFSYTYLGFAPVFLPLLVLCLIRKGNRDLKILGILYLVFLCLPVAGSAFNGFGYITNRWCFAVSFFAGLLAVRLLPELSRLSKHECMYVIGIPLALCMAVFAGCFVPGETAADIRQSVLLSYLVLFATLAVVFCLNAYRKKISTSAVRCIFLAVICISVCVNTYERFSPRYMNYVSEFFDRGWANPTAFGSADALAKEIHDETFWRYEYPEKRLPNNSMLFGKNGTSFYFSEVNRHIIDFFELYGLYKGDEQHLRGFDSRTALQAVSCAKYYIKETESRNLPHGFVKVGGGTYNGKKYDLYENENALPVGFLYRNCISEEDFFRLDMVEREAELLNAAVVHDCVVEGIAFEKPSAAEAVIRNEFSLSFDEEIEASEHSFSVGKKDSSVYISFVPHEDAAVYLVLEDVYFENDDKPRISVYAGNESIGTLQIKENFSEYGHQFVVNLGALDADGVCTVQIAFHEKGSYSIGNMYISSLPYTKTDSLVQYLHETVMEGVSVSEDCISGSIYADSDGFLFLSVPFSDGWKAFVDGVSVPLYRTQIMYSGLFVPHGKHTVTLRYSNPFIKAGAVLSLIGFVLLILVLILGRRKHLFC